MAAGSIDSVITDPPYGLDFMGKEWDHGVPGVQFWVEALRVAKPGATLFAFGGTRTWHRLAVAIEDAGWEIRDTIMWVYGTGFPKSHNIGKAIDKAAGAKREVVGESESSANRAAGSWQYSDVSTGMAAGNEGKRFITTPATSAAKTWDGYGTALKPAWEPIIIAMRPIDGTFANNAQVWGVAGLNIDEARVRITDGAKMGRNNRPGQNEGSNSSGGPNSAALRGEPAGRWPANLIHDGSPEVLAGFPELGRAGHTNGGGKTPIYGSGENITYRASSTMDTKEKRGHNDTGSASRFFYCAKSSKSERTHQGRVGNRHPTVKPLALMEYLCTLTKTPYGGTVLDPFMGSGSTGVAALRVGRPFIGIEQNAESFLTAQERLRDVSQAESVEVIPITGGADFDGLPLFAQDS